jgi:hypothetical protein
VTESTKNTLCKVAKLTEPYCKQCSSPNQYRCCDRFFCSLATITMKNLGVEPPKETGNAIAPYMGDRGCVVSPEYRPICSGFVCGAHLVKDRKLRREWARLNRKFNEGHDAKVMCANYPKPPKGMPRDYYDYEKLCES